MNKLPAELRMFEGDMETVSQMIANESLPDYKYHYLTAAEFSQNGVITAWYNQFAYHSAALSLDLVHNAIVKSVFGDEYSVRVTNAPLPLDVPHAETDSGSREIAEAMRAFFGLLFVFIIYIIMAIFSAKYITFYIEVCN